jgi:RNA polymerase sigma-70 factor (ECF subfamily)
VTSDRDLVTAVLAGDRNAYAFLVGRYERAVHAAALEVLRNHHAAQDAAQEAFVAGYRHLGSLRDAAAFGAWILRIARHEAVRMARQRSRMPTVEPAGEVAAPQRNGQLDEASRLLLDRVSRLPEQERVVLMLRYFGSHSVQEVAQVTGRPLGTVTKQLSRAVARLRAWLGDVEP